MNNYILSVYLQHHLYLITPLDSPISKLISALGQKLLKINIFTTIIQDISIYSSFRLHSFADLKFSFIQEVHSIRSKIETQEYVISQLHQYLQKIIEKQSLSFNQLRRTILALCKELASHAPQNKKILQAKKALEGQCDRWNSFGSLVKERISRLSGKSSQSTPPPSTKYSLIRSQPIKLEEKGLFDSEPSYSSFSEYPSRGNYSRAHSEYSSVKLQGSQANGGIERDEDRPDYKLRMHEQFDKIREYVHLVLAPMLEYDEQKIIPKKIVLNNYIDWNRQNSRKMMITSNAQIQMELTVQVKNAMPNVVSVRKMLKGITFKKEFADKLQFTDRAPPITDIPFNFDHEEYFDPIDEIIKEGKTKKSKVQGIELFSEEQNTKLNSYLGL